MKCVCGYERAWQVNSSWNTVFIGDEDFIRITPKFWNYEETYLFNLYVCPKCGTVRAEKQMGELCACV